MNKVYHSIEELIGGTPLVELHRIEESEGLSAHIFGKLERSNPAGSAKDRVGLHMIEVAEREGRLQPGGTIIEPTSGNTGIGIAAVAAARGYHAIIVMPDTMSRERQLLMKAYGAELVLSDGKEGMAGAIALADKIKADTPGSIIAGQFENPANPEAHYLTTGPEIYEALEGKVDAFVAGIGTGGTITGVGRFLREKLGDGVQIIGVEPAGSPFLTKGTKGPHDLQGIGAGFAPAALDCSIYDEVITITDEQGYDYGRKLAAKEGLLCGITSGAALAAAALIARRESFAGKNIVALLPDTGERYLSTKMFAE